ncbi:Katanin p60 ATPase-containing subunit A1 [Caligus rogercresseyi]|uniref:Katanin p60 ATPase-containing subunit A1 n=1 Tax=Caligus rogercresseyi TaxID=217165 RepID=A0A7T8GQF5_CALRO|nr:Katanin p60 ATPase-containing subunit A1 [Caligus rogercresseyi]
MAVPVSDICENTKLARENSLMGNYETASVYYQGLHPADSPPPAQHGGPPPQAKVADHPGTNRCRVRRLKNISQTLALFKSGESSLEHPRRSSAFSSALYEEGPRGTQTSGLQPPQHPERIPANTLIILTSPSVDPDPPSSLDPLTAPRLHPLQQQEVERAVEKQPPEKG